MRRILLFCLVLWFASNLSAQSIDLNRFEKRSGWKGIFIGELKSDSLFHEKQSIVLAEISLKDLKDYQLKIAYSEGELIKTSKFGSDNQALVALNAGFFNVEKGGSVSYIESDNQVIARNRTPKEKYAKSDSLLNGAIVLTKKGSIRIEKAKNTAVYEKSTRERQVLVSGPILMEKGKLLPLEHSEFVKKRHPRSCLALTKDKRLLLLAIDGRSEKASGMSLYELQQFLVRLNCRDAINLDGGGSTTLWFRDGDHPMILNSPSDKTGERPVANALLICPK
ncbi:MAG: phosphodiester glycosidase family protein [Marinilabiliales bacterium]|nr:phosphodiester glycosidase family protein [Marinilabiliales bacterium]